MKKILTFILVLTLAAFVFAAAAFADGDGTPEHDHDWGEGEVVREATERSRGEIKYVCSRCGEERTEQIPRLTRELVDSTATFKDVKRSDWFAPSVDYVMTYGLMVGTSANRFEPESGMTRAMIVTVLWRFEGSPSGFANNFKDVPADAWYAGPVAWAGENGIVAGTGGGKYEPDSLITREQLATIMYRYTAYIDSRSETSAFLDDYYDGSKVSDWAKDGIKWAVAEGIIRGMNDLHGRPILGPAQNATRAEFATILMRYCSRDEFVHAWGEGEKTSDPTCTEKGNIRYVCVDCGAVKNEAISALGHIKTNIKTVKQPTCTEKGESSFYCTRCEKTLTEPIGALGHNWRAATCTLPKTCLRCGLTSGSALGHTLTPFCTRCDYNNREATVKALKSKAPASGATDIGYFEVDGGYVLVQLFTANGNPAVLTLANEFGVVFELRNNEDIKYSLYVMGDNGAEYVIGGYFGPNPSGGWRTTFQANSYSTDDLNSISQFVSGAATTAMYCLDTEVLAHTSEYLGFGGIY